LDSVKIFWLDREKSREEIKKRAQKLVSERPEVKKIFLFGSLADNKAVPGSDADLLIILKDHPQLPSRLWDRIQEYEGYFENLGLPVDLFCYTEEEVQRIPLAREAIRKGLLLAKR